MRTAALVTAHDPADVARVNAVQGCYGLLGELALHRSNVGDIGLSESAQVVRVAARPVATPLCQHVLGVLAWFPDEKVGRPDAKRVVARVANEAARLDIKPCQLGGVDVRSDSLAAIPEGSIAAGAKRAPSPAPAVAGLVDVVPETSFVAHLSRRPGWASACRSLVVEAAEALRVSFPVAVFGGAFHVGNVKTLQRSFQ